MNRRDLMKAGAAIAAGTLLSENALAEERALPPAPAKPRLVLRRAGDRGRGSHGGWLEARYTFSFSRYRDPRNNGFRSLRVMNEDVIQESRGFPMHPHRDMEILTYILDGALQHKDSVGNGSVIVPGDVQRMSAGRGIRHSEFNPSRREDTHLYQIWLLPTKRGTKPSYAEKRIPYQDRKNTLKLIASPSGTGGSISIGTDVNLYSAVLAPNQKVTFKNVRRRHVWIQIARGSVTVNRTALAVGDGARTSDPGALVIKATSDAELLLFDLA